MMISVKTFDADIYYTKIKIDYIFDEVKEPYVKTVWFLIYRE